MHEMALAEGVLQLVEDAARRDGFGKVKTVWLEIGALASVEPEAFEFCFDVVTRGSIAQGAKLEWLRLPVQAWCLRCSQPVSVAQWHDACPLCGSYQVQVTGGGDMRVKELEVE
jgi:hydrogenase nickel incorporation protein HypA/HybF